MIVIVRALMSDGDGDDGDVRMDRSDFGENDDGSDGGVSVSVNVGLAL